MKKHNIDRINFYGNLGTKKAALSYFLQEGPATCNAKCAGCYAGAGINHNSFLPRGIISPAEAETDISQLIKEHRVLLRGTEILMNPKYIPLLKLAQNKNVLTNGIVIGQFPDRLNLLAENEVSNITITYPFDAPATSRNLSDILAHKGKIDEGIRHIKNHEYGFALQLSALITSDCLTDECLSGILEQAVSLEAGVVRFVPYMAMSGEREIDNYALSKEQRETLVEKITEFRIKYNPDLLIIDNPGMIGLFPLRAEKNRNVGKNEIYKFNVPAEDLTCPAGLKYFAISAIKKKNSNGRIYRAVTPCHFRMDAEIGRYYGGSDLEIDNALVERLFSSADRTDCVAQNYWYEKNVKNVSV